MAPLSHKKRKKFARFQFAIAAFRSCNRAIDLLQSSEFPRNHPANEHLFTSLVVTYYRPFTSNNGIGPLDLSELNSKGKEMHDLLRRLRNEVFGHTDGLTKFDCGTSTNRLRLEVEPPAVYFSSTRVFWDSDLLAKIARHLAGLIEICEGGSDPILAEIDIQNIPSGDYLVNIESSPDDLLIERQPRS